MMALLLPTDLLPGKLRCPLYDRSLSRLHDISKGAANTLGLKISRFSNSLRSSVRGTHLEFKNGSVGTQPYYYRQVFLLSTAVGRVGGEDDQRCTRMLCVDTEPGIKELGFAMKYETFVICNIILRDVCQERALLQVLT